MTDPIALRNRFAMVKGAWEDHLPGVPFPRSLGDGGAEEKIERLELALVDEMRARATPESAEQVADAMWGIVHARPDGDPVKQRVTRAPRGARAPGPPPAVMPDGPPAGPLRLLPAPEAHHGPAAARSSRCACAPRTTRATPKYPRVPVGSCPGYEGRSSTR